jgi:hypothetical protein
MTGAGTDLAVFHIKRDRNMTAMNSQPVVNTYRVFTLHGWVDFHPDIMDMLRVGCQHKYGGVIVPYEVNEPVPPPEAVLAAVQAIMVEMGERWRLTIRAERTLTGGTDFYVDRDGTLPKREAAALYARLKGVKSERAKSRLTGSKYDWQSWEPGQPRRLPGGVTAVRAIANFASWAKARGLRERLSTRTVDGALWATRVVALTDGEKRAAWQAEVDRKAQAKRAARQDEGDRRMAASAPIGSQEGGQ